MAAMHFVPCPAAIRAQKDGLETLPATLAVLQNPPNNKRLRVALRDLVFHEATVPVAKSLVDLFLVEINTPTKAF